MLDVNNVSPDDTLADILVGVDTVVALVELTTLLQEVVAGACDSRNIASICLACGISLDTSFFVVGVSFRLIPDI